MNSGGAIVFPAGAYRLTATINVPLASTGPIALIGQGTARILMHGAGPAFHLQGDHRGTADPSTVAEEVWERQRMPIVDALEIVGRHPQAEGLLVDGAMQLTISRLAVRRALHGVHLIGDNRNVILSECHLYHNTGVGVYYDDVNLHQSNITNCHISYNGGGGVVSRRGNVRNIQITGCDIEANMDPEGPPTANILLDASGSPAGVAEVAIVGCTIQHSHSAPNSANVRFIGGSREQGAVWGHLTIGNNVLSDAQINIELVRTRGAVISGNTFWKGYQRDLVLRQCRAIQVGANVMDNNPKYHYGDGAEARQGVLVEDCQACNLSGLLLENIQHPEGAIVIRGGNEINVVSCAVSDAAGPAIVRE